MLSCHRGGEIRRGAAGQATEFRWGSVHLVKWRGVEKESVRRELLLGRRRRLPRLGWKLKYGSIIYSTRGKEFADGGMNEAGRNCTAR